MMKTGAQHIAFRHTPVVGLMLLIPVALTACSPRAEERPPPSTPRAAETASASAELTLQEESPEPGPTFELLPPDPLYVEVERDLEHAAGEWMPVSGGTITAFGADGSIYTLTVPEDALLSPTWIVLIPARAVLNLELDGGLVAGVEILPEGLQLMRPAVLTITPAEPYPLEDEISFAVHGEEQEALLYPLLPKIAEPTFLISHFSSYGVATGSEENRNAQSARSPRRRSDQYNQRIAGLMGKLRQQLLQGLPGDPKLEQEIQSLIDGYYASVLEPLIAEALVSNDYKFICQVIQVILEWERSRQMVGIDTQQEYPGLKASEKALTERFKTLYLREAERRCQSLEFITGIRMILSMARQEALLGIESTTDFWDYQERCGRLELSFRSRFDYEMVINGRRLEAYSNTLEVQALVPLQFDWNMGAYRGSAALEFTTIAAHPQDGIGTDFGNIYCLLSWSPTSSMLDVHWLIIDLNRKVGCEEDEPGEKPEPPKIMLALDPGKPAENFKHDCSNIPDKRLPTMDYFYTPWWKSFDMHHSGYVNPEMTIYGFNEWKVAADNTMAWIEYKWSRKDGAGSIEIDNFTEDTRLEIRRR